MTTILIAVTSVLISTVFAEEQADYIAPVFDNKQVTLHCNKSVNEFVSAWVSCS